MVRPFQVIVLTPAGLPDPSVAIAACRAGGLGVLDLEYLNNNDLQIAFDSLQRIEKYTQTEFGIRLSNDENKLLDRILAGSPERLRVVVFTPGNTETLKRQVRTLHRRGIRVLLEVICQEEAEAGVRVGVDGVIAKGHEAGGRIGEETTFVLLQRLLSRLSLPVWARGGIGLHSAAACYAAGAAGVVLDSQLALTRESALPEAVKSRIAAMDGSETVALGSTVGEMYRVYTRPGVKAVDELRQEEQRLAEAGLSQQETVEAWRSEVRKRIGWDSPDDRLLMLGQDAAFAASLARRYVTVGGVLSAISSAIESHVRSAARLRPLDAGAPLAQAHNTVYPIIQGPMTRVSDTAAFAASVAEEGALPFLALALMRAPEVRVLLEETRQRLADRPWGVGILGFVPLELRQEQLEVIREFRPRFALIAGGRPDQALGLEREGITTYLHVPSPELLKQFLRGGARRFVFEGRECGGHVGPRSSFVLWESMIDVLQEHIASGNQARADEYSLIFAGGIHDARSASMVAVMAAPLAAMGVRIGVLMGTAYLFTEEAVANRAILKGFQEEAIRCDRTVLLETGPGHSTRCVLTPYAQVFAEEKRRLIREGKPAEEIRIALEELNLGRLRIASKGITRPSGFDRGTQAGEFLTLSEEEQRKEGMYMIGQVAALRDSVCTMAELHREVAVGSSERLEAVMREFASDETREEPSRPSDVAIIGMACLLPKANDVQTFWENILNKVNAITEIPRERWDWELYFDPDPKAKDKVYSKWGGFIDDIQFDPLVYGMPPNTLRSIEPMHLLTLEVVRAALKDAGYLDRQFNREKASVILGAGGGAGDLGQMYGFRSALPMFFGDAAAELTEKLNGRLPEWTEDSFPGILMNVAAGRVANRFDLGGVNYTVDAACASSLAAVELAVKELEAGTSDMVIVGGIDTIQSPFAYLCFSKTPALSPRGEANTFDESGDGIVISEGLGVVILKRLADAERDGDRIYAVIKGVRGSSDGRDKGLTAPRPEGQVRALDRAYKKAGVSPATVRLFEAHGTGTVVGDQTEVMSLSQVLEAAGAPRQSAAIGSVKSMIGHTKCTAGVAGLIKVALALYHKVLPPTLGVTKPNPRAKFEESALYVNSEARPWIRRADEPPRRAGVSAFGFGGTNFHAVVEEYSGEYLSDSKPAPFQQWPSELLVWRGPSRQALIEAIDSLALALERGAQPRLRDLAFTLWKSAEERSVDDDVRLAIIAASLDELRERIGWAKEALAAVETKELADPRGIYFSETPLARDGKVAFLFPGQGSQYINMLKDLAIQFPEVREAFERADMVIRDKLPQPLSSYIFPRPTFTEEEEKAAQQALTQTNVAQPAIGIADMAMFYLLRELGIRPELVAGHSYGEYVALCAAGAYSEDVLVALSEARGRFIVEEAKPEPGTMAAVEADVETVAATIDGIEGVVISNLNAPKQTIISGMRAAVEAAVERFKAKEIRARPIPVACAFHSPLVFGARQRLADFLAGVEVKSPQITVFSNTTAAPYPSERQAVIDLLADHLVKPVKYVDEVRAMYAAGARVFVEVGTRAVMSGLTAQILAGEPHVTVATDQPGRNGLTQLQFALGQLFVQGVAMNLDRLFRDRSVNRLGLATLVEDTSPKPLPATVWLVNGNRALPAKEAIEARSRPAPAPISLKVSKDETDSRRPEMTPEEQPAAAPAPSPPAAEPAPPAQSAPMAPAAQPAPTAPVSRDVPAAAQPPVPMTAVSAYNGDGVVHVMSQFQQLMGRFLDTQRSVMLTFLQGAAGANSAWTAPAPRAVDMSMPAQYHVVPPAPPPAASPPPSAPPVQQHAAPQAPAAPVMPSAPASAAPSPPPPQAAPPSPPPVEQAPAAPVAASTPKNNGAFDEATLRSQLLAIVSERTGYPPEMLDLDLDLEADLGIDSIKRVEILGRFQQEYPSAEELGEEAMEALASVRTLRGIIEWIGERAGNGAAPSTESNAESNGAGPAAVGQQVGSRPFELDGSQTKIRRFRPAIVEVPVSGRKTHLAAGTTLLITDDERGIAAALADELSAGGVNAILIRAGQKTEALGQGVYTADLHSPAEVETLLAAIREQSGRIDGLIHLLPLRLETSFADHDIDAWRDRLHLEVKSLFYLAKGIHNDLRQAAQRDGAYFLAVTGMGGDFAAAASDGSEFFPGHGGIAGLTKTLAHEWPDVRVKVVDLDPRESALELASNVLQELLTLDPQVEVGYQRERRLTIDLQEAPISGSAPSQIELDSSSVVLVTGGARGITAAVAQELAERYQPTLVLAGRSALPNAEESPETAALTAPQELKAALMAQLSRDGQKPTLQQIEAAYNRLLQDREIRENLAAMRQTGANVHYYRADVRDAHSFGKLIDEIYETFGRLDGVIHGAGVIEDKLIRDKTPESFDRVFDTKADSAFVLSRKLRPESLKFVVFFSSVAGRLGNRGQGDYAAANEVMSKLAAYLASRWPARVVSIDWGPWATAGMVSPELQKEFARRGVELIPIEVGRGLLDREIRHGRKGEYEVVLAGGNWPTPDSSASAPTPARRLPLTQSASVAAGPDEGALVIVRRFDPGRDVYLQDHKLDGQPVLPMAMATELVAEAALQGWSGQELVRLRDLRVLQGIVLQGGGRDLRVAARPQAATDGRQSLAVIIADVEQTQRLHYRAVAELSRARESAPQFVRRQISGAKPFPLSVEEAYRQWLFHGPLFQGIKQIHHISPDSIAATLLPSRPQMCIAGLAEGEWVIDPVVVDCGLQLVVLWARAQWDMTPLPTGFKVYHRYGPLSGRQIECHVTIRPETRSPLIIADIAFCDEQGRLLGLMEGLEGAGSKALNRLAAVAR